jgi:hypothetical protein
MRKWPYLILFAVLIAGVAASSIHNIPRITPAEAGPPMMQVICSGSTAAGGGSPECGETQLAGDSTGTLSGNSSFGSTTRWKAWKMVAAGVDAGTSGCVKLYVELDGSVTSDNVGIAIYSHDAGNDRPDTLLASEAFPAYNWTTIGTGLHSFVMDITVDLDDATDYWVGGYGSGDVKLDSTSTDATGYEIRYSGTGLSYDSPPAGSAISNSLSDLITGISLW